MNKTLIVLKYILIGFLSFIVAFQFTFIIKNEYWDRSVLIPALIPFCFIIIILYKHWITWLIAIGISIYGIMDIFYWGTISATFPPMEFTRSLAEFIKTTRWISRLVSAFPTLLYLTTLIVLALPITRRKYFKHAK
ncbi:hypothetical protein SAMN05518672_1183 [Chitinophaga sp. CF118]|uniref:hypothetical protein n=1 Tax=Chitinophaga sp. CF118 TaxID=1884367 RepID=UPI0008E74AE2|nr:hypothetical protein [Chitinophaga sp. CF118]SFF11458.1 hypothetical protein SAMN05518672_1183 [Chitinophaga sp. CF118]